MGLSSEDDTTRPGTVLCNECSRCRLDESDEIPCLRVYGLITSIAYQRASYCAERLYGALSNKFDPPLIRGMLDFEWDTFLTDERRVHGPRLYEARSGVLVWDGDYFVGDDQDLVEHIAHDFVFSFPANDASFFLHMVTEYYEFLRSTEHLFATMDFSVGKHPVGSLMFELYSDLVPATCENFLRLVEGSASLMLEGENGDPKEHVLTYTGTRVHRIVREGWLQCGDVINVVGGGGHSAMGQRFFPDEPSVVSHARRGVISMCNQGPHSNASQFFITLAPTKWMDSMYIAFGQVVEGAQTLRLLESVKTLYENPVTPIEIKACNAMDPSAGLGMPATRTLPSDLFPHPSPASSEHPSEDDVGAPEWDERGVVESVVDVRDVTSLLYEERFLQGLYSLTVPEALVWRAFDASREQMDEELARRLLMWLARRAAREAKNADDRRRDLEGQLTSAELAARMALEEATSRALTSLATTARSRLARRAAEKVVTDALLADDDDAHYTLSAFLRLAAAVGEELAHVITHPLRQPISQEEAAQRIAQHLLNEILSKTRKSPQNTFPESVQAVNDVLDRVLLSAEGIDPYLLGPAADTVRYLLDGVIRRAEARVYAYPVTEDYLNAVFDQSMDAAGRREQYVSPLELADELLHECLQVAQEGLTAQIARDLFNAVREKAQEGETLYVTGEILADMLDRLEGPDAQRVLDAEAFSKLLGEDFDPGDDIIFAYSAVIAREILRKARQDADEMPYAPIVPLFAGLHVESLDVDPIMQCEKEDLVRGLLDRDVLGEVTREPVQEIPLSRTACAGVVRGLLTQDIMEDVQNEAERRAREAFRKRVLGKAKDILQGALELVAEIQWAAADVAFKYGVRSALPPSHIGFPPGDVRLLGPMKTSQEKEREKKFEKMKKKKPPPPPPEKLERKFETVYPKPPTWPPPVPGDDPSYYHPGLAGTHV